MRPSNPYPCRQSRRAFLGDTGMGFTGLALGAMLGRCARGAEAGHPPAGGGWAAPDRRAHFRPRAKAVIWIFLCGGVSHLESFDVKPALNKYAGLSIDQTPYKAALDPAKVGRNIVGANPKHGNRKVLMPLNTGYARYGQSGLVVGDWFKNVGTCADDLAVVRSLWTVHNDHGAQLTFQTGRHPREGAHPTLGSWVTYGLAPLSANLPEFVVLGRPTGDCCGGTWTYGAGYLGPQFGGVHLEADPKRPLPFISSADPRATLEEQTANLSLIGKLNTLAGVDYPDDADLRARIKSYELAFAMQQSIPETLELEKEDAATRAMYGIDQAATKDFGTKCLVARRMVERGVRFVQLFHGGGGGGDWDAHGKIKENHTKLAGQVDLPIAGLIKDLKRRGLLDETVVVFGTEFGRSPGAEGTGPAAGRDHHPNGFSGFMAGGGVKGGVQHGATDEIGFHAAEDPHYVTDLHATVLKLMGLESHRLEVPGRKRLEMDHGRAIEQIIA